jgi:hypothetical protein
MEGYDKEHGMDKIRKMMQEIKNEENESDGHEHMHDPYDIWSPKTREEHDKMYEEQ